MGRRNFETFCIGKEILFFSGRELNLYRIWGVKELECSMSFRDKIFDSWLIQDIKRNFKFINLNEISKNRTIFHVFLLLQISTQFNTHFQNRWAWPAISILNFSPNLPTVTVDHPFILFFTRLFFPISSRIIHVPKTNSIWIIFQNHTFIPDLRIAYWTSFMIITPGINYPPPWCVGAGNNLW